MGRSVETLSDEQTTLHYSETKHDTKHPCQMCTTTSVSFVADHMLLSVVERESFRSFVIPGTKCLHSHGYFMPHVCTSSTFEVLEVMFQALCQ